jgi:DNA helicase-2/ATP-dependent DNA helicase PcrA
LKILASPHDSVSLLRIINTPARGIGKGTIDQIEQYALKQELSVWSAIGRMLDGNVFPARAEAALRAFRNMIQELAAMLATDP